MARKSTFPDFPKNQIPDLDFFGKNHPLTKTELTKKFSQIGPAVPEEIGYKHYIQANILLLKGDKKECTILNLVYIMKPFFTD